MCTYSLTHVICMFVFRYLDMWGIWNKSNRMYVNVSVYVNLLNRHGSPLDLDKVFLFWRENLYIATGIVLCYSLSELKSLFKVFKIYFLQATVKEACKKCTDLTVDNFASNFLLLKISYGSLSAIKVVYLLQASFNLHMIEDPRW